MYLPPPGGGCEPWPMLKSVQSPLPRRSVCVNRAVCVVGARSRVHLPLASPLVSRVHALIVNDGDAYIRDLASRNHVFVNDRPVREAKLHDGDLLRVGPFAFRWQSPRVVPDTREFHDDGAALILSGCATRFRIDRRTVLIGQRPQCDVPLCKPQVSPVHAVLFQRSGKRYLRDLNSHAGTFVNGRRIREVELRNGDEIRIGVTFLHFECTETVHSPPQVKEHDESVIWVGETSGSQTVEDLSALAAAEELPRASRRRFAEDLATPGDFGFEESAVDLKGETLSGAPSPPSPNGTRPP